MVTIVLALLLIIYGNVKTIYKIDKWKLDCLKNRYNYLAEHIMITSQIFQQTI